MWKKEIVNRKQNIRVNKSFEGLSTEQILRMRMEDPSKQKDMGEKEPVYTERKDGVIPQNNIRTDRHELAQEAENYIARTRMMKRDEWDKNNREKEQNALKEQLKAEAEIAVASLSTQGN